MQLKIDRYRNLSGVFGVASLVLQIRETASCAHHTEITLLRIEGNQEKHPIKIIDFLNAELRTEWVDIAKGDDLTARWLANFARAKRHNISDTTVKIEIDGLCGFSCQRPLKVTVYKSPKEKGVVIVDRSSILMSGLLLGGNTFLGKVVHTSIVNIDPNDIKGELQDGLRFVSR